MTAHGPNAPRLRDVELIAKVRELAAVAEAEIEAAYRFREGSAVREWHLERADTATVELLGLINGAPFGRAWERFADCVAPMMTVDPSVPSFLRTSPAGGLA